ncbi:MAG: divergent PAP2 family protein [bacterium]
MRQIIIDFLNNATYWSAIAAWTIAQIAKVLCNLAAAKRDLGGHWLIRMGGMPSSHSATVCSLATSVGWHYGAGSPIFGFAAAFAILVMFDASTTRRAAGMQAKVLNQIVADIFKDRHVSPQKVIELIGHTHLEVFFGMIMGIVVAVLVNSLYTVFLGTA